MACIVYLATKMTNKDKHEQVARAKYACAILKQYGITPLSPVFAENVEDSPGPLVNDDKERLGRLWARDKEIIRYESHVVLVDGANEKSYGVEREYMLNRGVLWKPTVLLMPPPGLSVITFEDDYVTHDLHIAGEFIRKKWGTRTKRIMWRLKMLTRTLPRWILGQIYAFR